MHNYCTHPQNCSIFSTNVSSTKKRKEKEEIKRRGEEKRGKARKGWGWGITQSLGDWRQGKPWGIDAEQQDWPQAEVQTISPGNKVHSCSSSMTPFQGGQLWCSQPCFHNKESHFSQVWGQKVSVVGFGWLPKSDNPLIAHLYDFRE